MQETADTITIHFAQPEQRVNYLSGQFLTLISEIEGKEERGSYSLCSSPYIDKNLSVAVKGGKMSNHLNNNLKVGDLIVALPPMGNFKLKPENSQRHILLVAGGSGITPLFSIIKPVLIKEPNLMVSLIYVNSNRENTIFYQQLEQWYSQFSSRFHTIYYWSGVVKSEQPKAGFLSRLFKKIDAHAHRINPERLKVILNDLQLTNNTKIEFYIFGPQELMEMTKTTIQEIGFSKELVHKENFYTGTKTKNTPTEAHQIKILLKGKEREVNVSAGFGAVQNPIQKMMEEHETEGERFRKIDAPSNNYTPPEEACNTYRVTFSLLQEFEDDLHKHIHLENNILFPKAAELEEKLCT